MLTFINGRWGKNQERGITVITYRQVDSSCLKQYDKIPMLVHIETILALEKLDRGLGGIILRETPVTGYIKDFGAEEKAAEYGERFDLTNWSFFMAFDGDVPIGGATVASKTEEVNMLDGRDDLTVLWDIRVDDNYKGQGVGTKLFAMAVEWSKSKGFKEMKIECQNNNVAACRFYHKQGAVLAKIDEYAYFKDMAYKKEVQFIWYLDLS